MVELIFLLLHVLVVGDILVVELLPVKEVIDLFVVILLVAENFVQLVFCASPLIDLYVVVFLEGGEQLISELGHLEVGHCHPVFDELKLAGLVRLQRNQLQHALVNQIEQVVVLNGQVHLLREPGVDLGVDLFHLRLRSVLQEKIVSVLCEADLSQVKLLPVQNDLEALKCLLSQINQGQVVDVLVHVLGQIY